ncbi:MAG: hypothetical protein LBJ15_23750, partial [Comamonas sp.]|nr:hypothetical protein [Comamonas sp.]
MRLKIRMGSFVIREYFPEGCTVAASATVAHQLDHWLSVKVIENSTQTGDLSAVKFWKPFIGEKLGRAQGFTNNLRRPGTWRALGRRQAVSQPLLGADAQGPGHSLPPPTTCATPMRRCCSWQVQRQPTQPSRWGIR